MWKRWNCYGEDPSDYTGAIKEIHTSNDHSIRIISEMGVFFMGLFSLLSFVESYGAEYRIMYLTGFVCMGLFWIGYHVVFRKYQDHRCWIYLLLSIVFGFGIQLSTQVPEEKSVVFLVLMVVVPVLFIDYSFRMSVYLICVVAFFSCIMCMTKTGVVLHSDIYNGIGLGMVAIIMHYLAAAKIVKSCINQHQKDFTLSELKLTQKKLKEKARSDQMTGLLNRNTFIDVVTNLMERSKLLHHSALLILDLNKFKEINDTYGHQQGDLVIQQVAEQIKASITQNDFVGRLGGDEFIILVAEVKSIPFLEEYCRRLLANINTVVYGKGMKAGVCIGVSLVKDEDNFHNAYSRADQALYRTKRGEAQGFLIFEQTEEEK